MQTIRRSLPLALAVLSLVFSGYQFVLMLSSDVWRNPSDEMVTQWEDHVRALREALPSDVRLVGYVDDSHLHDNSAFDGNEFQLMQYSLAPIALEIGVGQEWLIGNFNDDTGMEARLEAILGAHETQGFGFGLYLIHDLEK